MQKAARDLSSRRVPLVRVPLVLGSVAFWCREKRVRVRLGCDVCQGEGVIGQTLSACGLFHLVERGQVRVRVGLGSVHWPEL